MIGQRFGKLTVIERLPGHPRPCGRTRAQCLCKCDCGETHVAFQTNLKFGSARRCRTCRRVARMSASQKTRMTPQHLLDRWHETGSLYRPDELHFTYAVTAQPREQPIADWLSVATIYPYERRTKT